MNNPNIVGLLSLALYILIKDVVVPLLKRMNHNPANPVSLSVFYQEFRDWKEVQKDWKKKTDERLEKLEGRR